MYIVGFLGKVEDDVVFLLFVGEKNNGWFNFFQYFTLTNKTKSKLIGLNRF